MVVGSTAAGASSPLWFNKFNPFHQFDQANVLDNKALQSLEKVSILEDDIFNIKLLLSETLLN